jgi:Homing endonuclease associated repeat
MKKYTKEQVITILQDFAQKTNGKLTKKNYQRLGYLPSYPTIVSLFGSWHTALQEAGLTPASLSQYTDEDILEAIRNFYQNNQENPSKEQYKRLRKKPSVKTIEERFGSWSEALKKAGLQPIEVRNHPYTDEEMLNALRRFYKENGNYISYTSYEQSGILPSASVIRNRFGTWNKALKKANLPTNQDKSPTFTEEQMIMALRRVASLVPSTLSKKLYKTFALSHEPSAISIIRHFGTWNRALESAGLPAIKKKYTEEEILSSIQQFVNFYGEEQISLDLYRRVGWLPGETTILRYFGTWENALSRLGLTSKYKKYTKEWALEQLGQILQRHGGDISAEEYTKHGYKPSISWLKRHFDSWKKAKEWALLNQKCKTSNKYLPHLKNNPNPNHKKE